MIEEARVSFEVAKLLKEKGFDKSILAKDIISKYATESRNCCGYSMVRIDVGELLHPYYHESICFDSETDILAPTQQMVMRWLREVHNLYISIDCRCDKAGIYFCFDIFRFTEKQYDFLYCSGPNEFDYDAPVDYTYEEATEAAIKYALKNLI